MPVADGSGLSELTKENLTKEEWQAINNLLSYQPDGELALYSGKDEQAMTQLQIDVSVNQAAAKIIDIHGTEVVCGRFEQLNVLTKFKHRSTYCDVLLRFYGLYAPEGCLSQVFSWSWDLYNVFYILLYISFIKICIYYILW